MIGPVGYLAQTGWSDGQRSGRSSTSAGVAMVPAAVRVAVPASTGVPGASTYVVQLIAARDGLPQARDRRRAEPADGCRLYRAAACRVRDDAGPMPLVATA